MSGCQEVGVSSYYNGQLRNLNFWLKRVQNNVGIRGVHNNLKKEIEK